MIYILTFVAAAAVPLFLASYGAHLATLALDREKKKKRLWIIWGFGALGFVIFGVIQLMAWRVDKHRDEADSQRNQSDKTFRLDVSKKLSQILEQPDPSRQRELAAQLKAQIGGFVQFEKRDLRIPESSYVLHSGEKLQLSYSFANRGTRPVYDVQSWGSLFMGPTNNDLVKMKGSFKTSVQKAYESNEKIKGAGNTLGAGIENFNLINLQGAITQKELDDLIAGTWRMYFVVVGAWRDDDNTPHYWVECQSAELLSVDVRQTNWHTC